MERISEINEFLKSHNYSTYERSRYDKFLSKVKFSFTKKCIHITGTNGKGSVANFLYNIYLASGYKVGMYNSPYLNDVKEMIHINNRLINDEEYISLFNEYYDLFLKYDLSSFEIETFIALTYFERSDIDIAIIEVGMGGYIDATNVIEPLLSVITNVSLEHTSYLGRSVSEIAYSKAGIIKEEKPVLIGKLEESALYAVSEYAKEMDAPIKKVNDYHNEHIDGSRVIFDYYPFKDLVINTKALYQCMNASLAIEATQILNEEIPASEEGIRKGLMSNTLPCRYEYINEHLMLDGSHNPDAIDKLCDSLSKSENKPIHVIFASFKDKNIEKMLISLSNLSSDVTITTFDHIRARKEEDYFLYLGDYSFNENYLELIKSKLNEYPDDLILVTGSLAFTGVVRSRLNEIR